MDFDFPYDPMTEEEIQTFNLLEEGYYPFETVKSDAKISSSGNKMIELVHRIFDKNGREHLVYDYLVAIPSMAFKIKHYCDSTGMEQEYKDKKFNSDLCQNKKGFCYVTIKEGDGKYQSKNNVKDYVTADKVITESPKENKENFLNEDIPF